MANIKQGERVIYTYVHYTNSRTCFERKKKGVAVKAAANGIWIVLIDGNKNPSRIHESKLQTA